MDVVWNPWHGCKKYSAGCAHCYVYRMDARHGRDASAVQRTQAFDLPVRRARGGDWKIPSGSMVYTCFTSDFLLEEADGWRMDAWRMMRQRSDLSFLFITKRIVRLGQCLPPDWGQGYPNVHIGCTVENEEEARRRLPAFVRAPICYKHVICEPLLGPVDLSAYLSEGIVQVMAGGESGAQARVCRYEWILALREQCQNAGVKFVFKQTGAHFEKDGRLYDVPRKLQHVQAKRAGIHYDPLGGQPCR